VEEYPQSERLKLEHEIQAGLSVVDYDSASAINQAKM
jgi:hypothetical protein